MNGVEYGKHLSESPSFQHRSVFRQYFRHGPLRNVLQISHVVSSSTSGKLPYGSFSTGTAPKSL